MSWHGGWRGNCRNRQRRHTSTRERQRDDGHTQQHTGRHPGDAGTRTGQLWAPSRPVTLVVGFPPGRQTDFAACVLQPVIQQSLGVPVVIDNRAGASGNIATKYVMRGRPDG